MDVDWSSVVPTLAGAIVGGALSLAGSVFASGREVRRQRRLRIYEKLLPQFDELQHFWYDKGAKGAPPSWFYDETWPWLVAILRSAALTGPTERWRVRRLIDLQGEFVRALQAVSARSADRELTFQQQNARDTRDVMNDLNSEIQKYRRLLARKIR